MHTVEMGTTQHRTNKTVDIVDMGTNTCRQKHNCNHKIPFTERSVHMYEPEMDKIPETQYIEVFQNNSPIACSGCTSIAL